MKPIVYFLSALMLVATAEAKKKGGGKRGNNERAKQEQKEKEEKKKAREKERDAIEEFLKGKDKNNDKSLSLDEFLTGESDVEGATVRFNDANKNGDRYLTKMEISAMLGF